jgi:histidine ammonia-lyase
MREPLSTRCAPQVLGAARESVARARRVVDRELNATIDNPSLFPDGDLANNAGTMDAQALSEALDALATSAISVAVMSERRTARLLDPALNGGLPAFLVHPRAKPGVCSGLMIAQYTAAALVAELRAASAPASVQSLPVSNGTEDHGSMSALAARRAATVIGNATLVVAVELLVAAQAVDLRGAVGRLPPPLAEAHRALRGRVPVMIDDRLLGDDIDAAASCLQNIA